MEYILSEKNKEFLWNISYEKNIFFGIPNNNQDDVKKIFEYTIKNISDNTKNSDILEINKEILKNLNDEISMFKIKLLKSLNTKDEFKDEKIVIFDKKLENHKTSLNELLNPVIPSEIDFKDDIDKPINNNDMNKILEEMQKERNITTDKIKIPDEKIIKPDNIMNESKNDEVPKLKIESIEELLESEVVNLNKLADKKVEKMKNEGEKLKSITKLLESEYNEERKLNSNVKLDNISELLNKLLINQEKIMSKLDLL